MMSPQKQADTDESLRQLSRGGWTLIAYGEREDPTCLVAYQRQGDHVDVFVMAGEYRCAGYRAPLWPEQDPVEVQEIVWHYLGDVAIVLRQLLDLPPVDHSWPAYPMPADVPLPPRHIRRRTIRPPQ